MSLTDFISEANTSCTIDTSFSIKSYTGAKFNSFGFMNFFNLKAAAFRSIFVSLNLQRTFTCLVTNRTIQGMVCQDEFKCIFLSTLYQFIGLLGKNNHSFTHI